jgi:hypothetical protein
MNPLESLKQKLKVKPIVEERERVAVVIKGDKQKPLGPKKNKEPTNKKDEELLEFVPEIEKLEENVDIVKKPVVGITGPLIIDKTEQGYNRMALLQKLKESKMSKVFVKPLIEEVEEPPIIQQIFVPKKRAKKVNLPLRIEEEEDDGKRKQDIQKKQKIIIEGDDEDKEGEEKKELEVVPINVPEKKVRKTKKIKKGLVILGPETVIDLSEESIRKRLPRKDPPVLIKVSNYYMNNREIFINFINSLFEPYRLELQQNKENISCDDIGNTNSDFSLLTHQKIVRDYMNLYTPYRGLLLYHGLGSGKTCTSIAIAEGMKDSKRVVIMTPASLRANYIEELKKCGDLLYKRNQYWEWVSTDVNPEALMPMATILNLNTEYITKHRGAWFINITKPSNYDELSDINKKILEEQLNAMINNKYTFINYNGLRIKKLQELTSNFTRNLFDNSVVIIDEAHNLISRIVNKIKKEKPIPENKKGEKEHLPLQLSVKLYEFLLSAKNVRIVLLTGTPVINYPNEFGILFNILRGYIKTWKIPINIESTKQKNKGTKIDKNTLKEMLLGVKSMDYLDYSPSSNMLTITKNPFGFTNKIKKESGYQGVTNTKKDESGITIFDNEFMTDDDFERKIVSILYRNNIDVVSQGIEIKNKKALPDTLDLFEGQYIDFNTKKIKNIDALKRRIIGLSSYFRSAQENLLPKYDKIIGQDYHIVRVSMSNFQFSIYESARREERKTEKYKPNHSVGELYEESSSSYRIFSRLYCNFVMPDRPIPKKQKILKTEEADKIFEEELKTFLRKLETENITLKEGTNLESNLTPQIDLVIIEEIIKKIRENNKVSREQQTQIDEYKKMFKSNILKEEIDKVVKTALMSHSTGELKNVNSQFMKDAKKVEAQQDMDDEKEGEVEIDEILDKIGGIEYKERLNRAIKHIEDNSNDFLTPEALQTYSPKFLNILENIQDTEYIGLHLVYSQFRTIEGIGIFSLVLDKNGFTQFKIKKSSSGIWSINIDDVNKGKPTYALYTGTETTEEKEMLRHIYNGEWDQIPESISVELRKIANNNNMGEVIKVFMITSSGSEGINLRNTRYVHIMEPYWHPVRVEQVIGRARRICSHKALPKALQTVEVFVYLMIFTPEQLKSDDAIELKRKDLSKSVPHVPMTSDQYLYEISEIKANLTVQLTDAIKESSFDCYIYSNGKCVNFGDPTKDKFSYVPDYSEQQNDTTVLANKQAIEWTGKSIRLNGVDYVYRRMSKKVLNIYDKASYEAALIDPTIIPLQIGTLEKNEAGEDVFKQLVS